MSASRWSAALLSGAALAGCGGAGGAAAPGAAGASSGTSCVVATPAWGGATGLEWRAVAATRSARWLVRVPGSAPIEVDVVQCADSVAPPESWERAAGAAVSAEDERVRATALAAAHLSGGRLVLNGASVATRHASLLDAVVSPDGRSIAVLSADGAVPGVSPLGGGANARGAHAVEVFELASARRTALVPLTLTTETTALSGHWSGDASLLIYADALLARLCFVRLS